MGNFIKYKFKKIPVDEVIKNSSEFYEMIKSRRSVREFSSEDIPQEVVNNIIKAAAVAPSGANKQPWFFYVIKDKNLKKKIREEAEKVEKKNYEQVFTEEMKSDLKILGTDSDKVFLEQAPYLIVVCKELYKLENGKKKKNYYVNESVNIAVGFMLVAIHYSGLSTVTYTPNPTNFLKELLNIPVNLKPVMILPIAYPRDNVLVPNLDKIDLSQIIKFI